MKKTFIAICCIAFMFSFSSTVFAATTSSQTSTGDQVSVGTLKYNPSPSVGVSVASTDTDYAITTANSLTDTSNGMEYGTKSTSSGYAQRTKTTNRGTGPEATTDAQALPTGGTWTWQGGS